MFSKRIKKKKRERRTWEREMHKTRAKALLLHNILLTLEISWRYLLQRSQSSCTCHRWTHLIKYLLFCKSSERVIRRVVVGGGLFSPTFKKKIFKFLLHLNCFIFGPSCKGNTISVKKEAQFSRFFNVPWVDCSKM